MSTQNNNDIVILSAARTPMGSMQGELSALAGHELGAHAIKAAVEKAGIDGAKIEDVLMGCVLPAGQGQAPARQAALGAGLPKHVTCTTVNKVCGSGMRTVMMAHDQLKLGNMQFAIAGGMESMTNAPYLLKNGRSGYRFGHSTVYDHMTLDGLEDAYAHKAMGEFGEMCADKYQFTREAQDEFALASINRAKTATEGGAFEAEITPITIAGRKGDTVVSNDEGPRRAMPDKIPNLRPAFTKDGTITAANASSISDGASAIVLARAEAAEAEGLKPLAKIVGHATFAQSPEWFTTAPVGAMEKLLKQTGWTIDDVDLFEINEAFAVVTMAAMKELAIPHEKVNVHGGACALGHPIGASGTRIITTLVHALRTHGKKRGIAALCIGGGEATAIAVEVM